MAAPQYGYTPQRFGYGYAPPQKPARPLQYSSPFAMAAAGKTATSPTDPFGLIPTPGQPLYDGGTATNPIKPTTPQTNIVPPGTTPATPPTTGAPPPGTVFDINSSPSLIAANALIGLSEDQANAEALKQRQGILTNYGDAGLSRAVLGDETWAKAAEGNPFSTLAQLRTTNDRATTQRTEDFNKQNLSYSGARVLGEEQAAHDYQQRVADAAAQVNGALGSVSSNLVSALAATRSQRIQALQDAYDNNKTAPGVTPPPADGGAGNLITSAAPDDDYRTLLALAAAGRRPVHA